MTKHLNWIDVTKLSFNSLLLLEKVQLSWFPGWVPEELLGTALHGNPAVAWYLRHKCPELNEWLDIVMEETQENQPRSPEEIRQAEEAVMATINDLMVYAVDPSLYDARPFLNWNSTELTSLVDFSDKIVIDVGSGTGKLALIAAGKAAAVYAVDPVASLRQYLKTKARKRGFKNVYTIDGLITDIPLADGLADVTMGGHVFGDNPQEEFKEMKRVTRSGGMVILCPGNNDRDDPVHQLLVKEGFSWRRFEEPQEGMKRKYWKAV